MLRSPLDLRRDALQIWAAGVDAARSDRLMRASVRREGRDLVCGDERVDLNTISRIAVVGAGKAGAGMAATLETILGPDICDDKQLTGWVNVPDDCIGTPGFASPESDRPTFSPRRIHLHPSRPPGVNEATAAAAVGAEKILQVVSSLGPADLCIVLLSGGGSALLPAPVDGITLADKIWVTRFLSAAGADIVELNTVRKQLSRVKRGGLARACGAGQMISLIISDVLGDPLDMIASGPTVPDRSTPQEALAILQRFDAHSAGIPASILSALQQRAQSNQSPGQITCRPGNVVIGNNETAVMGARRAADELGYSPSIHCANHPEGAVELIGRHLADKVTHLQRGSAENCFISGGEGTVKLAAEDIRGRGGRNQQTALAALARMAELDLRGAVVLAGGTDGEDGSTDAAGAIVDESVIAEAGRRGLNAADFLARNDAYSFFDPLGALIKTGPTHTNVCDLRVVLVDRH